MGTTGCLPCTSRNIDLQDLLLLRNAFPLAPLALVLGVEIAPAAVASGAGRSFRSVELSSHLEELLEALTVTRGALLRSSSILSTLSLAQTADDVLRAGELDRLAFIQILQGDFIILLIGLWWSTSAHSPMHTPHPRHAAHASHTSHPPTHAEHLREDIIQIRGAAGLAGAVEGVHAMGIVEMTLILIIENIVGLLDRLELDVGGFALVFGDLIRVTGEGGLNVSTLRNDGKVSVYLAISLADVFFAGRSVDSEDLCVD